MFFEISFWKKMQLAEGPKKRWVNNLVLIWCKNKISMYVCVDETGCAGGYIRWRTHLLSYGYVCTRDWCVCEACL